MFPDFTGLLRRAGGRAGIIAVMRIVVLLMLSIGLVPAADPVADSTSETVTMQGSYVAGEEYPDTGKIEAVFTATASGTWQVVFDFDFQESEYTFTGIAEGGLSADGPLQGTVHDEAGKRTFKFRGTITDGVFHGTHAEVEFGGETPTGTMKLAR